jgi:L-lysine exporter family protein LysE/ArgO
MLVPFLQGAGLGGGLIVAIGAQNAFVLSQGVRRNHPLPIALLCGFCDALLILLGVSGVGRLVASNPLLGQIAVWGGALFLFWYGLRSLQSALRGGLLDTEKTSSPSLRAVLGATLAVSLLNPHVYLDTLVLLGGISGQFPEQERYLFGLGAMTASFAWFLILSLGAGFLAPLFRQPVAWRILDSLVFLTMWSLALSLLWGEMSG